MTSPSINGADLLVECLHREGVTTLFGMPGGQTAGIYDALYRQGKIRQILVRNEHAGAMMADGFARACGQPGVCLVTAGPGLTNAITGLGTAYADSIPLLLVSGQIPRRAIGAERGYYHEMDQLAVTKPLTKWNALARRADEIPELVQRAFQELRSGRPRPVHLDIPIDVAAETTSAAPLSAIPGEEPSVSTDDIERAVQTLRDAERPLIIAGGGVISADACRELLEVAQLLGAPVLTTPMGKGCVPDDHPLAGGMLFHRTTSDLTGMQDNLSPLPRHADAVLAVGCRFSQLATGNWELKLPKNVVQVDIDGGELGRNYPIRVGLTADAKTALTAIRESLRAAPSPAVRSSWSSIRAQIPAPTRWHIQGFDLVPILRAVLDREAIISCDVTRLYYMLLASFPIYAPRTFLHPSCFISMGYGLPAALGAKAALPDRQVVAIAGDGGFLMTGQELACAVQSRLNVVSLVINDHCLSAMKGIQLRTYGARHIAVDLVNPDFVRFAESFGAIGFRVDAINQLEAALRQALAADRPAVVEVRAPQTAE